MTEGKGYVGRRQERRNRKQIAEFIENRDRIVIIPDEKREK